MVVIIMPPPILSLEVPGIPRPQGSKKPFVSKGTGRAMMKESSGDNLASWRADVTEAARRARPENLIACPVQTVMTFKFPRPKSHYGTGRNVGILKATAPAYPISRGHHGDLEKLERAINDSIGHAGVWIDDVLVVDSHTRRVWATDQRDVGVTIDVFPLKSTITEPDPCPGEVAP